MGTSFGPVASTMRLMALLLTGSPALAQQGPGSTVDADRIMAILTEHAQWMWYWSSLGPAPRPPASAGSGTVEFARDGDRIRGHISIPVMNRECESEVVVKDGGFGWPGCPLPEHRLVRSPDKEITYDPDDREYPFKGTGASTWYWFRPR
jgi:hypothetical protein